MQFNYKKIMQHSLPVLGAMTIATGDQNQSFSKSAKCTFTVQLNKLLPYKTELKFEHTNLSLSHKMYLYFI